jgi:hypothetical protein
MLVLLTEQERPRHERHLTGTGMVQSHGAQRGDGLAIAGIIIGFGWVVLFALGIAIDAANNSSSSVIAALFGAVS